MSRYNTNNPVPSNEVKDFSDNAQIVDEIVHSQQSTTKDRFGNDLKTWRGIQQDANEAISQFGYITMDSFQDGATLTLPNQVLRWKLPDGNGEHYRWDGAFPVDGKLVPPGSTPETTGGIGPGAWVGVGDASLRSDLSNPDGSKEIGYKNGDVYNKLNSTLSDARIIKECVFNLTTFFDGYDEELNEIGGTYLAPQGFDISDDGYLFINHVSDLSAPTKRAVSVYDNNGLQVTWFYIKDGGTQSISVEGSLPSIKIYDKLRDNSGLLSFYELVNLPTAGSFVSDYENTIISGFTTIFSVKNDVFCGFSAQPKIGSYNDDSLLIIKKVSTGETHASIPLSRAMTGFVTTAISGVNVSDYYKLTWKLQGISLSCRNTVLLSFGGVYHEDESWTYEPLNNFTDIGVAELSMSGEVISSTIVKNTAYVDYFTKIGVSAKRTENEGVSQDKEGNVYTIILGDIEDRNSYNLFIFKEYSFIGEDFSKYASIYSPPSQERLENPIREADGRYSDPLKRSVFSNVNDVLRHMVLFNVRNFSWYAEIEPQLIFSGVPHTAVQWYALKNLNNGYFVLEITSVSNQFRLYRIQYDLSASTYSIVTVPFWTNSITTGAILSPGNYSITVGDGFVYPTTAGAFTLGTSAKPYKEIYLQTNPIITSDLRLKNHINSLSNDEKLLSQDLKSLIKKYELTSQPNEQHIGFIAQDVIDVFDRNNLDAIECGIVRVDNDGMYAINYNGLILFILSGM